MSKGPFSLGMAFSSLVHELTPYPLHESACGQVQMLGWCAAMTTPWLSHRRRDVVLGLLAWQRLRAGRAAAEDVSVLEGLVGVVQVPLGAVWYRVLEHTVCLPGGDRRDKPLHQMRRPGWPVEQQRLSRVQLPLQLRVGSELRVELGHARRVVERGSKRVLLTAGAHVDYLLVEGVHQGASKVPVPQTNALEHDREG